MEYTHRGVDGLDVSYPVHIPEEYVELLLDAQKVAASKGKKQTHEIEINGVKLWVRPKGHSGGYAFSCTTGFFGENLYLKMPNGNDPWGLKVSVNALPLATKGLHYARTELEKKLLRLGMKVKPGEESISRIDVAVDLLVGDERLDEGVGVQVGLSQQRLDHAATEFRCDLVDVELVASTDHPPVARAGTNAGSGGIKCQNRPARHGKRSGG